MLKRKTIQLQCRSCQYESVRIAIKMKTGFLRFFIVHFHLFIGKYRLMQAAYRISVLFQI